MILSLAVSQAISKLVLSLSFVLRGVSHSLFKISQPKVSSRWYSSKLVSKIKSMKFLTELSILHAGRFSPAIILSTAKGIL